MQQGAKLEVRINSEEEEVSRLVVRLTAAATLFTFLCISVVPFAALAKSVEVEVQFGTPVSLRVLETISPVTHRVGQQVILVVDRDVIVDKQVIITAGTQAICEISRAVKQGSVGKAAEISVEASHVKAVDGTVIALKGEKVVVGEDKQTASLLVTLLCCVLALLMKGTKAEIISGSTFDCEVYGGFSVEVEVEE